MPGLSVPRPRPSGTRDSRVLVLSQRNVLTRKYLTMFYELEDLLGQLDDVQLLAPPRPDHAHPGVLARGAVNGALQRAGLPRQSPPWTMPSMRPTRVDSSHDLFFAVFGDAYQLSYLQRLPGWRERCRRAVCFLTEVWSPQVPDNEDYYRVLREFDAVYLFTPAAGPALEALGAPRPAFLPVGVHAERSDPQPHVPPRLIDVYAYGRTSEVVHRQLLDLVESTGLTYFYDTTSLPYVPRYDDHRLLLANSLKRSTYCLTHRINDTAVRRDRRTLGEESLSSRYFEASAGGAVMLGSRPDTAAFDEAFDWPDAVIDLPYESPHVAEVLHDLGRQPERLAQVRSHGVRAGLLRHDWVYRWERVLGDAGLATTDAMQARKAHLAERAATATPEALATARVGTGATR